MNCFHFSVSLGYKTTMLENMQVQSLLWIAFIFQYLWDTKQQMLAFALYPFRCELLSFFSIFGIQNNGVKTDKWCYDVVNCFHFSVSLGYKTTFEAFQERKHGCELLSFFSIFGIQNNRYCFVKGFTSVVNCFHFSVSLGYKTTQK